MKRFVRGLMWAALGVFLMSAASCEKEKEKEGNGGNGSVRVDDVTILSSNNLYGKVSDALTGEGIAGVPVSDGWHFTTTDAKGVYQFAGHAKTRVVYLTVPAAYEIPMGEDGYPCFYQAATLPAKGQVRRDFTLTPRADKGDAFTLFLAADTHVQKQSDLARFTGETLPDIKSLVRSGVADGTYRNPVAMVLGDFLWDNAGMATAMKKAVSGMDIGDGRILPFLPCIGNHDHDGTNYTSDYTATQYWVDNYGPTDWSLDLGKAHIISMDNILASGGQKKYGTDYYGCVYSHAFTNEQVAWLKEDLALVDHPENKIVILCVHCPFIGQLGAKNFKNIISQLTAFHEAHIFSGHSHILRNVRHEAYVCKGGRAVYEHNIQATSGTWWLGNISSDGAPMGYGVFRFSGNTLFESINKTTLQPLDYQMRVYDSNDSYNGKTAGSGVTSPKHNENYVWNDPAPKNSFLVRIWDAIPDEWTVEFVKDGVSTPMTWLSKGQVDACAASFNYNILNCPYASRESYQKPQSSFWTIEAPCGDPAKETGWTVVATHRMPGGWKLTYRSSKLMRDYQGFAAGERYAQ